MYNTFTGEVFAKARLEDVDASFKDLAEVCRNIKGKDAEKAVEYLELASKGLIPVRFRRHNKKLAHRKELGGKKGRYPVKAAKIVLRVLQDAIANANYRGVIEPLKIVHASANKKHTYFRLQSKGRQMYSNYETARVEIVLKGQGIVKKEKPKEQPKPQPKDEKKEEPKEVKEQPKEQKKEAKEEKKEESKKPTKEVKEEPKEQKKQTKKSTKKTTKKKPAKKKTTKKGEKE